MNLIKFNRPKVGVLLIGSPRFKHLGEGLTRGTYHFRKSNEVNTIIETLQKSVDVVFPEIVYSREDLLKAMDIFSAEKIDFVLAEFLSWSEDFAWIRFLRDMPEIPILLVNPVKKEMPFVDTLDEEDFIEFLCAGTLVGSLEASGSIQRVNRKNIKIIMGSREEIVNEVLVFSKAAKVRNVLRHARFGVLASYNELMWSTYIDPYNLFARIGPELSFISYSTLADEIAEVSDEETTNYQKQLEARYKVMPDVENDKFFASAKASIGLAKLAEKLMIDTMIFNDIDTAMFKLIGLRPGFYHPSLNQNLSALVPEADVGGGLITFILKLISGGKHVNFIEPFHIETVTNTFAGGHAGPNDHNDPAYESNVIVARDVRFAKTNYKYAGAPFAWYRIPPGRKTMAQLTEVNGSYKLVSTMVDSLEGNHMFASYSHSIFRPLIPVTELFERILKIGTTQHFAIVDGDYRAELSALAAIIGFQLYEI
jgi:L-arabinose isomerase